MLDSELSGRAGKVAPDHSRSNHSSGPTSEHIARSAERSAVALCIQRRLNCFSVWITPAQPRQSLWETECPANAIGSGLTPRLKTLQGILVKARLLSYFAGGIWQPLYSEL
jgi:hypothetical protein